MEYALKKKTGSYYTCEKITEFMARSIINNSSTRVLEPSFGDGIFIEAIQNRFKKIGNSTAEIYGVEIQKEIYENFCKRNAIKDVICDDFMKIKNLPEMDAVIGNPPFVRIRNLDKSSKENALNASLEMGIDMQTSGSLWMPFILHSCKFLKKDGSLSFVLPYEITYVKYAFPLWLFLKRNFSNITIVRIQKDFFPDVDVETVILTATGFGGDTNIVNYCLYKSTDDLFDNNHANTNIININDILSGERPFVMALLTEKQRKLIAVLKENNFLTPINKLCKFKIGYVSAHKEYFHPTDQTIRAYNLPNTNLTPIITNMKEINKSKAGLYLNEGCFSQKLYLPKSITEYDQTYIDYGLSQNVHKRYKCKQRKPWYVTPDVNIPDMVLTVFGNIPKLLINSGKYNVTNSLLCGYIKKDAISAENIASRWYNSLTLLSIELQVHSLGGGVLVLVPGEADTIMVLSELPNTINKDFSNQINRLLVDGKTEEAYQLGDSYIFNNSATLGENDLKIIREALDVLRTWRMPERRKTM